jgi:uridine kinase
MENSGQSKMLLNLFTYFLRKNVLVPHDSRCSGFCFSYIYLKKKSLGLLQRDMAERGHSLESIKASIEARKPDFDAFIGTAFLLTEHNKCLP